MANKLFQLLIIVFFFSPTVGFGQTLPAAKEVPSEIQIPKKVSADGNVPRQSTKTLKVLTYNTYYVFDNQKQIEAGKRWVKSQAPDVVALQELTNIKPEKLEAMAAAWGHEFHCLLKPSGFSVGLTSRWPIEVLEKRIQGMHHGYLHVQTNGIHHFVVHLSPFQFSKRRQEADTILAAAAQLLESKKQVIILGDFNAFSPEDEKWLGTDPKLIPAMKDSDKKHKHVQNLVDGKIDYVVMRKFLSAGLADTAKAHVPDTRENRLTIPTGIWGDKKTAIKSGKRVDFILVSSNLYRRISKTNIVTQGIVNKISDHYPVITEFTKKTPANQSSELKSK